MHTTGAGLVGCIAADKGAGIAWVALLRCAAGWWILDCAKWQVLGDGKDAAAVGGAATVIVLVKLGGFVDGASPRILGHGAP